MLTNMVIYVTFGNLSAQQILMFLANEMTSTGGDITGRTAHIMSKLCFPNMQGI